MTNEQIKKFLKKSRKGEIKGAEYAYDVLENQGYSGSGSPVASEPPIIESYHEESLAQLKSMDSVNLSEWFKDSYMYMGRNVVIPGINPIPSPSPIPPEPFATDSQQPCSIADFLSYGFLSDEFFMSAPDDIFFTWDLKDYPSMPQSNLGGAPSLPNYISPKRWLAKALWECDLDHWIANYPNHSHTINGGFSVPIDINKDGEMDEELSVIFSLSPSGSNSGQTGSISIYGINLSVRFYNYLFKEYHELQWVNGHMFSQGIKKVNDKFEIEPGGGFEFSNYIDVTTMNFPLTMVPAPNTTIDLTKISFLPLTNFEDGEIIPDTEFTTKLNDAFMTAPAAQIYQMVRWTLGSIYGYVKDA
jgi:hypothetical protein